MFVPNSGGEDAWHKPQKSQKEKIKHFSHLKMENIREGKKKNTKVKGGMLGKHICNSFDSRITEI